MRNGYFWMGRTKLEVTQFGEIKYTKVSKATRKPYSKSIPLISICNAKSIYDNQGLAAINRKWHNALPEGKNRPCNLKVIEKILNTFS